MTGMDEFFRIAQKLNTIFCIVAVAVITVIGFVVYNVVKK